MNKKELIRKHQDFYIVDGLSEEKKREIEEYVKKNIK